jgi:cell wall-associated NlpC family hydrolase
MVEEARAIAAARVPWIHLGRHPRAGLDCIGVPVCCARAAGLDPADDPTYPRQPDVPRFVAAMRAACVEIEERDAAPGDVPDFRIRIGRDATLPHVALYVGGGRIVHSWQGVGHVVENDLDADRWRPRLVGWWRIRELAG